MVAHTMFSTSPFKPAGYSQAVTPIQRLGGFEDWVDWAGDFLGIDDINASNVDEFLGKIDDLIEDLPVGTVKKEFTARRAECMTKSAFRKYSCLWDLFQDAKKEARNKGEDPPVSTEPPSTTVAPPQADGFPWVPVGIAGGITVAALVYLVVRKKP